MRENKFQLSLRKDLESIFPGCIVLLNDPNYIQGFPDILVLYENKWAALECKRSSSAPHRPNQDYYINLLNSMSYASFICPENRQEVLDELQYTFES